MMRRKILGDFQTPLPLAEQIVAFLQQQGLSWTRLLEPTCGKGNFIRAALHQQPQADIIGIETQAEYVQQARALAFPATAASSAVRIYHESIFSLNLQQDLQWQSDGPLLVVGNPPWVTNAEQGALEGGNLPEKSNFKNFTGMDALTGKSNFDIAEYIWIQLLESFAQIPGAIALLTKLSTARSVLKHCYDHHLPVNGLHLYKIDAQRWFNVAVEAGLLLVHRCADHPDYQLQVYSSFEASAPEATVTIYQDMVVADQKTLDHIEFIGGKSSLQWRQGVKHDAASVMELRRVDGAWHNKLGEVVNVEDEFIFPLFKSSDLRKRRPEIQKGLILTQRFIGQDTAHLRQTAPRLWRYLDAHRPYFDARKSSIYRGKPSFTLFGVGDYTFSPYKVMVSGFYRPPYFVLVEPHDGKPVVCDDTCYLLPCDSLLQATVASNALNHFVTMRYLDAVMFKDAKRPLTKTILDRINLAELVRQIPPHELLQSNQPLPGIADQNLSALFSPQVEQLPLL
ncbi:MAG: SAM-dependent methyltransferase [bacterium]|nr:SAM-dependent methyltransferase [bacterium]